MVDETKDFINLPATTSEDDTTTDLTVPKQLNLNEESLALIEQIITETNEQKAKDLTHLFNANQNKKTMVRVNKLSELLDTITDQALVRFTARPDEISNKELFDGLKIVQDLIERGQKQVSGAGEIPLIQVNNQTNEVNIGGPASSLNRDSRERVKAVVMDFLGNLTTKSATEAITIETREVIEENEDGGQ